MSKKWFHFALPMFIEAEGEWIKKHLTSAHSIKLPDELMKGVAELIKNHLCDDGKLMIFSETKLMPTKTPPQDLITTVEKKEYDLSK